MTRAWKFIAGGAVVAGLLILRGVNVIAPKGIRNHNPGNLRNSGIKWDGLTGDDGTGFCVFSTSFYGLRAMARNLFNYRQNHNVVTLIDVAERWAPATENNTIEYADTLAGSLNMPTSAIIDLRSLAVIVPVMRGIVKAENGEKFPGVPWFSDFELKEAAKAAGAY